ncbi:MAG: endonuclease/exonuclease/phosphatase family protein [Bacteroidota bacterium]
MKKLSLAAASVLAMPATFFFWASAPVLNESDYAYVMTHKTSNSSPAEAVSDAEAYSILTYNAGYASGLENNTGVEPDVQQRKANLEAIENLVAWLKPDVLALQEIDVGSARSYYTDQVDVLGRAGGFDQSAVAVNWDRRYVPFPYWPYSAQFGRVLSGQSISSRRPIEAHERIVLERPASNPAYYDAFYLDRLLQHSVTSLGGQRIHILNVHLEAYDEATRRQQARTVRSVYELLREDAPVLLVGDFNSTPPAATDQHGFAGYEDDFRSDDTIEHLLEAPGLQMAHTPETEALGFTYPSDVPVMKLDYVFYDSDSIDPVRARVVHEAGTASDHLPVWFEFRLK